MTRRSLFALLCGTVVGKSLPSPSYVGVDKAWRGASISAVVRWADNTDALRWHLKGGMVHAERLRQSTARLERALRERESRS